MSLRDRLHSANTPANLSGKQQKSAAGFAAPNEREGMQKGERYEEVKARVHNLLVDRLNLDPNQKVEASDVREAAKQLLQQYLAAERIPMSRGESDLLIQELEEEILGLGPLEQLLKDTTVADILVNGPKQIFVERGGKLVRSHVTFRDDAHLMHVIDRIVSAVGRRVDEKNPLVDSRMPDGSRFNAIIPPLAIDGPSLSIRKFRQDAGTLDKLLDWGSMTKEMAMVLEAAVKAHLNIVISGGTGSGKTTLLNSLSAVIDQAERIVTIEDSAELQLKQEHLVRLETRPANIEGEGAITARDLLVNCLRMRPDRIIVGECRGAETLDMLQAMNTGHDGSLTTLHANTPRDALSRIETMCMMNKNPLPEKTIRQQIASAVHLIVQASRLPDGSRRTMSISEVVGMEGNTILLQEIFRYTQTGVDEKGKVIGHHEACGVRPKFSEKLKSLGIDLPNDIFTNQPPSEAPKKKEEPAAKKEEGLEQRLSRPEAKQQQTAPAAGMLGFTAGGGSQESDLLRSRLGSKSPRDGFKA